MKEHFLSELVRKKSREKVKVTFYISPEVLKSVKHVCIDNELTLSEFFEKAALEYLKKLNEKKRD